MKKGIPDFYKDLPSDRIGVPSRGSIAKDIYRFYRIVSFFAVFGLLVTIGAFAKDRISGTDVPNIPAYKGNVWTSTYGDVCAGGEMSVAKSTDEPIVIATFVRVKTEWRYESMFSRDETFIAPFMEGDDVNVVACVDRLPSQVEGMTCQDIDGIEYVRRGGDFSVTFRAAKDGTVVREAGPVSAPTGACSLKYEHDGTNEDVLIVPTDLQLVELYRQSFNL